MAAAAGRRARGVGAQEAEVLGGGRRLRHRPIPLGGELQEALDPGAGVLQPLVAMRKEQDQPAPLRPLRLARREELVEDGLGDVNEVA